ncbi:Marine sediment metagenome DNA, contig: S12H4_S07938 OS=marine sediment metagenome GN=S12H4_37299 PE=4 SV=1: Glycos_transf_2 [Gemmata massiliana]|uniref:Glycosyltransferase 2-like domain-containing protein n=1 Tax=Gemmata massiliana TaxID=1210884 RepID=A0A6P2CY93_9BACT|nr:glycosyltransferase family 2 protein [Gemmata massiliana]VTR93085.1 Marine sediment metagenome DNA, contig: S12H4_S07938 OS=marine sediment metagenome GN=S12H4_37299 PE=4 SV=1: Glycos_transf_2 [Gemmata massiliana]
MLPLITVAIPVYNRRDLTLQAVHSVLDQHVEELEILAIDDCSTDDVWDALNTIRDPRLRLVQNVTNLGLFGNFNRCLELARGKYIRVLCCDDRLVADCLKAEIAMMDANPSAVLLSTRGQLVRSGRDKVAIFARHLAAGLYPGRDAIRSSLWTYAYYGFNPFNYPSGILLRRTALLQKTRFDERMLVAGDVDFFLRVLRYGDLLVADRIGCEVLLHDGQVSRKLAKMGYHLREMWQLTLANRDVLAAGEIQRFVRQLGGHALAWELSSWLRQDRAAAAAYAALRQEMGIEHLSAGIGLSLVVAHRMGEMALGHLRGPFRPQPIVSNHSIRPEFPPHDLLM